MTIGTWQLIALLVILSPTIIAFFCCLFLINKKSYKKLPKSLKSDLYALNVLLALELLRLFKVAS